MQEKVGPVKSLLLWEKGDREAVDEELPCVQDTSSVSLRLPPSPAGEGLQRESYFFPHHNAK